MDDGYGYPQPPLNPAPRAARDTLRIRSKRIRPTRT